MGDDKIIPVKVAVRIRPISKKEKNEGCQTALEVVENEPQVRLSGISFLSIYYFAFRFIFLTLRKVSPTTSPSEPRAPTRSCTPPPSGTS